MGTTTVYDLLLHPESSSSHGGRSVFSAVHTASWGQEQDTTDPASTGKADTGAELQESVQRQAKVSQAPQVAQNDTQVAESAAGRPQEGSSAADAPVDGEGLKQSPTAGASDRQEATDDAGPSRSSVQEAGAVPASAIFVPPCFVVDLEHRMQHRCGPLRACNIKKGARTVQNQQPFCTCTEQGLALFTTCAQRLVIRLQCCRPLSCFRPAIQYFAHKSANFCTMHKHCCVLQSRAFSSCRCMQAAAELEASVEQHAPAASPAF